MKQADLKTGPKLDALVAEKVMGCGLRENNKPWPGNILPYSTSIAAAWEVVEKLRSLRDGDIHIECLLGNWGVSSCYDEGSWKDFTHADTAPLAICLYALALKEKRKNDETS